jgi:hypothetical protein
MDRIDLAQELVGGFYNTTVNLQVPKPFGVILE